MVHTVECTYRNINNFMHHGSSSKCAFAIKHCGEETNYINTVSLYYCSLDEHIIPMILIAIPWLLLCFYWLSSTCERYLEPSLSKVAKACRLSESLAGVTIIAIANGAPDLISAYVASRSKQKEGINLAFGALFGASVFTTSIILARVIYAAKNLQLSAKIVLRDCGFYILADLYFFYLGTLSKISLNHILVLFITYFLYVVIVIGGEIRNRRKTDATKPSKPVGDLPINNGDNANFNQLPEDIEIAAPSISSQTKLEPIADKIESKTVIAPSEDEINVVCEQAQDSPANNSSSKLKRAIYRSFKTLQSSWKYIEIPLNLVRDFTIPRIDDSPLNKIRIALYPFFCGLFIVSEFEYLATYGKNPIFWAIFSVSSGILGAIFWMVSRHQRGLKILSGLFVVLGVIMAVLWVRLVADLLIDLLVVVKVASGLPLSFIGLTVLAWGNSANDFFVDVALAKKGHGIMAASGIFSGQFFNMQIGFGMLLLLEGGRAKLSLFNGTTQSKINYILVICSIVSLASTVVYGLFKKFNLDKKYANFLCAFYLMFCIVIGAVVTLE